MKKEFEFYNQKEIKKLLLSDEKLVYVDNGVDEFVVKYKDLPDFIVDMSRYMGNNCQLKVYKYPAESMNPILTTMGEFLDKCDDDVRKDIIIRLIEVQTNMETKNYKIISEYDLETVENDIRQNISVNIIDYHLDNNGNIKCNAVISVNKKEKVNFTTTFERMEYPDWKNSKDEMIDDIFFNWKEYIKLPKISKCSRLLKEIFNDVCESDSNMCHITTEDWDKYYSNKYTDKDIQTLKEEIDKYKLDDVITLKNDDNYKIIGWGDLENRFNDDSRIVKERDYGR